MVFVALHRMFRARVDGVKAYQYATFGSSQVRRPLPKGEGTEIEWVVFSEGEWWLVSKWATRLRAVDTLPSLNFGVMAASGLARIVRWWG